MSGIRAAQSMTPGISNSTSMPSLASVPLADAQQVQRMQDLLYDILATGVDSERTDAPVELVERFLHEHARTPKSAAEFREFFAAQGLTSRVSIQAPAEVASLPPLLRSAPAPRKSSTPPRLPTAPAPINAQEPVFDLDTHPVRFDLAQEPVAAPRRKPLLSFATAACMLVIVGALYAGSLHLIELRTELARSEQKASENRALIESLHAQTIGLESSLAANGELIQLMEQKSDLMIESVERSIEAQKKPVKRWR